MFNLFGKIYDLTHFNEMVSLKQSDTGLQSIIWVDDSGSYKRGKHYKRIKFQNNYDRHITQNFIPMKLDGDIPVKNFRTKIKISPDALEGIRNWVLNNKEALSALSDTDIFITDFLKIMIQGNTKAIKSQKEKQIEQLNALLGI
jgi:hypothetical protein